MADAIVVVNAGSSSVKFSVYLSSDGGEQQLAANGMADGIGTRPAFKAKDAEGAVLIEHSWSDDAAVGHDTVFAFLGDWLRDFLADHELCAVGHRVVHGGQRYDRPVLIDDKVLDELATFVPLAPLHQPHNLSPIRLVRESLPGVPQVACFDTAFHRGHRREVDLYAIPRAMTEDGIQRYGFHGLSYEYIARTLPAVAPDIAAGKVVVCHLGSGASMCAIDNGRSVDSTMGFTALDGLPMGTRCGSIDPGVLLHMMRAYDMDADAIERTLYKDCGLKGISALSNDMRDLQASDDPNAAEALDVFVFQIGKQLGALSAVLGGLDALVFTAGIGERSPMIRRRVSEGAQWLGVVLDDAANQAGQTVISTSTSEVTVLVIPTDEEKMIAMHTAAVLGRS